MNLYFKILGLLLSIVINTYPQEIPPLTRPVMDTVGILKKSEIAEFEKNL